MKVSRNSEIKAEVLQYQQAGAAKAGSDKASGTGAAPGDRISISSQTRDINLAKSEIDKLPEIREERVQELKKAVDSGTYQINAEKLAEKMITESIINIYA